jgi:hypothetical protein
MKEKALIWLTVIILCAVSCNDGISGSSGIKSSGTNDRIDRSKKTVIDGSKYIDMTARENDAARFSKFDILAELNKKYVHEGGNGYISFSREDGTVTISSDDGFFNGVKGRNFYARYVFEVDAANRDCLYIKPDKNKKGQMMVGMQVFNDHELPDLALCLPLYGFSRNRIEVSPVMNGYIVMPSGTYWVEKK